MGYVYPTRRGYCTYIHIRQTIIVGCGLGHLITGTTELSICTLENNRLLLTLVVMRRGGYCHLAEEGEAHLNKRRTTLFLGCSKLGLITSLLRSQMCWTLLPPIRSVSQTWI
jgi:hypothetical protein